MDTTPLFPFGYGLSYNKYVYDKPTLNEIEVTGDNYSVIVSINVTNEGKYTGNEIVQLYIGDPAASISRPVIELKDFAKVELIPNETKTLKFKITTEKLKFYNQTLKDDWEAGDFNIFVRPNSQELQELNVA